MIAVVGLESLTGGGLAIKARRQYYSAVQSRREREANITRQQQQQQQQSSDIGTRREREREREGEVERWKRLTRMSE